MGTHLPPPPELEREHLEPLSIRTELGVTEGFRPARESYRCADKNAPAILLVPGMGMDAVNFLRQLPVGLTGHLHLIENRTEPLSGEQGLAIFARYIEAFITAAKLDQYPGGLVLGGASMGGAMSLAVALRGRIRLRGLMLIGTFGSTRRMRFWRRMLMSSMRLSSPWFMRKVAGPMLRHSGLFGKLTNREAEMLEPAARFGYRYYVTAMGLFAAHGSDRGGAQSEASDAGRAWHARHHSADRHRKGTGRVDSGRAICSG
jgi:pimeloyl-ACP methyl ester carboxylesterase